MFVPVTCSQCGKPFQVPDSAVGKPTPCPWCQAVVPALPVGVPAPIATPAVSPQPLSLDEEPAPRASRRSRLLILLMLVLVGALATVATIAVRRHKEGYGLDREWRPFTAPDGSCAIDLPGRSIEDADAPGGGSRRYLAEGWYSGTTAWIGWRNLNAAEAQIASTNEAWHNPQLLKLLDGERDRLRNQFGGYISKDGTVAFKDQGPLTREVRLELPQGRLVERMIVMPTGPRPRIYFLGLTGKRLDPDGESVRRFFASFRAFD